MLAIADIILKRKQQQQQQKKNSEHNILEIELKKSSHFEEGQEFKDVSKNTELTSLLLFFNFVFD